MIFCRFEGSFMRVLVVNCKLDELFASMLNYTTLPPKNGQK